MPNNRQFDNLGDFISAVAGAAMTKAFTGFENIDTDKISAKFAGRFPGSFRMECETGKPLGELDLESAKVRHVAVLGPDDVEITKGDALTITVEGTEGVADWLRFKIEEGKLSIMRAGGTRQSGTAKVKITMPKVRKLSLAGSGSIVCDGLAGEKAKISIAGSGSVSCGNIEVEQLKVQMMGSGSITGTGKATRLALKVAGSGHVGLNGLSVESAKISMAGSGNASFASDGEVDASMAGSGHVTVKGRAKCTVKGMGSGRLVCEPA